MGMIINIAMAFLYAFITYAFLLPASVKYGIIPVDTQYMPAYFFAIVAVLMFITKRVFSVHSIMFFAFFGSIYRLFFGSKKYRKQEKPDQTEYASPVKRRYRGAKKPLRFYVDRLSDNIKFIISHH